MSSKPAKSNPDGNSRSCTRFPGITRDAEALGCNRTTLYRALTGKWHLPGLVERYNALKRNLH